MSARRASRGCDGILSADDNAMTNPFMCTCAHLTSLQTTPAQVSTPQNRQYTHLFLLPTRQRAAAAAVRNFTCKPFEDLRTRNASLFIACARRARRAEVMNGVFVRVRDRAWEAFCVSACFFFGACFCYILCSYFCCGVMVFEMLSVMCLLACN